MDDDHGVGYLGLVEANRIGLRAGPNVVYLRLIREFASERRRTTMFVEMKPVTVARVIRDLQACLDEALARADPSDAELASRALRCSTAAAVAATEAGGTTHRPSEPIAEGA